MVPNTLDSLPHGVSVATSQSQLSFRVFVGNRVNRCKNILWCIFLFAPKLNKSTYHRFTSTRQSFCSQFWIYNFCFLVGLTFIRIKRQHSSFSSSTLDTRWPGTEAKAGGNHSLNLPSSTNYWTTLYKFWCICGEIVVFRCMKSFKNTTMALPP